MTKINFSNATFNQLGEIFNIKQIKDRAIFKEWLEYDYAISKDENSFLDELIDRNFSDIKYYTELELVSKFIAPILNKINFKIEDKQIRDWYEIPLKYETEDFIINGRCDFVVARGYDEPINPYFFIQEFKQNSGTFPEQQLIAEMITATFINNSNIIKGAYIIGSLWMFVILEKIGDRKYQYFVSKKYDGTEIEELQQIYRNLQFVKKEIKK